MKHMRSAFSLSICIDAEYAPIFKKLVHVFKYYVGYKYPYNFKNTVAF